MTDTKQSDEEVICEFMEPKPSDTEPVDESMLPPNWKWWTAGIGRKGLLADYFVYGVKPVPLTLNALHLVEAKLTDEQWCDYTGNLSICSAQLIHATAEQKIRALAEVLRRKP